jgi:hypothetical protein
MKSNEVVGRGAKPKHKKQRNGGAKLAPPFVEEWKASS